MARDDPTRVDDPLRQDDPRSARIRIDSRKWRKESVGVLPNPTTGPFLQYPPIWLDVTAISFNWQPQKDQPSAAETGEPLNAVCGLNLRTQDGLVQAAEWPPPPLSGMPLLEDLAPGALYSAADVALGSGPLIWVQFQATEKVSNLPFTGQAAVAALVEGDDLLGHIDAVLVDFVGGTAGMLFRLKHHRIGKAIYSVYGVGERHHAWRWFTMTAGETKIGAATNKYVLNNYQQGPLTVHRIFTVQRVPQKPWVQMPFSADNMALPSQELLSILCQNILEVKGFPALSSEKKLGVAVTNFVNPGTVANPFKSAYSWNPLNWNLPIESTTPVMSITDVLSRFFKTKKQILDEEIAQPKKGASDPDAFIDCSCYSVSAMVAGFASLAGVRLFLVRLTTANKFPATLVGRPVVPIGSSVWHGTEDGDAEPTDNPAAGFIEWEAHRVCIIQTDPWPIKPKACAVLDATFRFNAKLKIDKAVGIDPATWLVQDAQNVSGTALWNDAPGGFGFGYLTYLLMTPDIKAVTLEENPLKIVA